MKPLFLFLVFFLPFGIAFNPFPGIDLALSRVMSLCVFFLWGARLFFNRKRPRLDFWGWCVLGFLFFACISLFRAELISWGIRKILVFVSFFPLYFVVRDLSREEQTRDRILLVSFFASLIVGVFGTLQYLGQFWADPKNVSDFVTRFGPFLWGENVTGLLGAYNSWFVSIKGETVLRAFFPFPDPHGYAMYLGMVIPLALGFFLSFPHSRHSSRVLSLFFFSASCFLVLALFFSFSRGAYLGLIGSLLTFVFLSGYLAFSKIKVALITLLLALFLFLVLNPFAFLSSTPDSGFERFETTFQTREGSNQGRIVLWKRAIETWKESPFLGVGIGNFPRIVDPSASYRSPINAHNTYLDIAAEMGVAALLLWTLLLFGTLLKTASFFFLGKKEGVNTQDGGRAGLLVGVACALVYFSIHSFFEVALYSPTILPFLLVLFAVGHEAIIQTSRTRYVIHS